MNDSIENFQSSVKSDFRRISRIGVIGDAQAFPRGFVTPLLCKILVKNKPDIVVQLGDHGMTWGSLSQWESFIKLMSPLGEAKIPWKTMIGNHEVKRSWQADLHAELFRMPGNGRWFSIELPLNKKSLKNTDSTKLIILDTEWVKSDGYHERGRIDGDQYEWLKHEISENPTQPKMIFLHRPLFPPKWHSHKGACLDEYPRLLRRLVKLLSTNNVFATFSGHEHAYHLASRCGMLNLVSGAGGVMLRHYLGHRDLFHHVLLVDLYRYDEQKIYLMTVKAIDLKGAVRRTALLLQKGNSFNYQEIAKDDWRFLAGYDGDLNVKDISFNFPNLKLHTVGKPFKDILKRHNRLSSSFYGAKQIDTALHISSEKP